MPALAKAGVGSTDTRDYMKWLRFYLDFRAKYEFPPRDTDSLEPFVQKLTQKGQSISQRKQAAHALSIYYRLMEQWVAKSGPGGPPGNREWEVALESMKDAIRVRRYSPKTLKTYRSWVREFQGFVKDKPPKALRSEDVQRFLTHLAVKKRVVPTTRNQALNSILFLFRHVLKKEMELGDEVVRARRTRYIPVVLSREEVDRIVSKMAHP